VTGDYIFNKRERRGPVLVKTFIRHAKGPVVSAAVRGERVDFYFSPQPHCLSPPRVRTGRAFSMRAAGRPAGGTADDSLGRREDESTCTKSCLCHPAR